MDGGAGSGVVGGSEVAAVPSGWVAPGVADRQSVRRDGGERFEGDGSERNHKPWIYEVDLGGEPGVAIGKLGGTWSAVPAGVVLGVAEDGVGDEKVVAGPAGGGDEGVQAAAGGIPSEGDAGAFRAEPPGRFADEHDLGTWWAVVVGQNAGAALHRWAGAAGLSRLAERGELSLERGRWIRGG
jgi:hypothetical protein